MILLLGPSRSLIIREEYLLPAAKSLAAPSSLDGWDRAFDGFGGAFRDKALEFAAKEIRDDPDGLMWGLRHTRPEIRDLAQEHFERVIDQTSNGLALGLGNTSELVRAAARALLAKHAAKR